MGANRIIILVAIALVASAIYGSASAKEIVAGNGSEADFSSIQEAVNNSSPGDVILVLPGTYNESVDVKVKGLSVLSESGNPEDAFVKAFTVRANNVTISGFSIQEYVLTGVDQGVQRCIIRNNKFLGTGPDIGPKGIIGENCFNCIFSDNVLFNSDIGLTAGADLTNITVSNNTIQDGSIRLGSSSENKIINNTISNTISDIKDSYGLSLFESHSNLIENNSISNSNYGISMPFLSGSNDVINNTLTSNTIGILIDHLSPGNVIESNLISNNGIGISIGNSCPNTLVTDNRIQLNKDYGIYLEQTSNDPSFNGSSLIYNNIFNNTVNLFNNTVKLEYGEPVTTLWNITKSPGTNIVCGPYLGGNFWAKPDGTGFSQMCIDSNGDGICDLPYNITENDSDCLPLTAYPAQCIDGQLILTETRITTNESYQYIPAINGGKIVWTDTRNDNEDENYDICIYDLSAFREKQITTNESWQSSPSIYDNRIVWVDNRSGNWDIYMYDLSTSEETQITTNKSNQWSPVIYGNRIVWADDRNGNADIYMYNLSTSKETQITTNGSEQIYPDIYGDRIVWEDWRNMDDGGRRNVNSDIYMYDISTSREIQITTNESVQQGPSIYGDRIVWTDWRNGHHDIYMCVVSSKEESEPKTPIADFSASPISGYAPLKVLFTDNSTGSPTSWLWDFGNGIHSKHAMNATHTFTSPGMYNVTLTVTNTAGSNSVTKPGYITVTSSPSTGKTVADFYSPEAERVLDGPNDQGIFENKVVSFFDNSTGSPTSWFWDFGDGNTSKQKNPTHAYGKIGGYTVNLTVKNDVGSHTISKYGYVLMGIKDEPATPAYFSSDVTSGNAPFTVTFIDDLDAQFPNYPIWREWDFGDGVVQTYVVDDNDSATPYATHTYEKPSKYTVTLSLDNRGGKSIITKYQYVTVTAPDMIPDFPVANFSANLTSGNAPLLVKFTDTGTGGTPASWLWDFGDGIYSKHAMNATHTYTRAGIYNVTLTVKNNAGSDTAKKTGYITVESE